MQDSMNAIDVMFQTEVNIENKTTEQLTAEINNQYYQAEQFASMSAISAIDLRTVPLFTWLPPTPSKPSIHRRAAR